MSPDEETPRPAYLGRLETGGVSSISLSLTVEQALDEIRLAVLGIVVGVAVGVGFGAGEAVGAWWAGVASFFATFPVLALLLRWAPSRRLRAWYGDWLLNR